MHGIQNQCVLILAIIRMYVYKCVYRRNITKY